MRRICIYGRYDEKVGQITTGIPCFAFFCDCATWSQLSFLNSLITRAPSSGNWCRYLFMEYLRQFYPSPLHNGTFCTWSIHFNNGAFIFVKVMIISWSLAICVIMLVRRWDSFKMAVNIFRVDLLVLVWRLSRGSTMGIPISFFFGRWCQPLSGNS